MQLLSVNVGVVHRSLWKAAGQTGIDKRPVDGPVAVRPPGPKGTGAVGLAGDRVYDIRHHGGHDQAVYAYAREDLDWWERVLGRSLTGGVFGENITTEGLDVNGALIGERWRIGRDVVLEVSSPRIPCNTFRGWMEIPGWIKQFTLAARPGAYLRVIEPGEIQAGDEIVIVEKPEHDVSVQLMFRALTTERGLLPRLLAAEQSLSADDLANVRKRIAR